MSEPFLGEIRMTAFNFAPAGWAMCEGQTLAISTNTALFALLGTTFGGNGTSTFCLPDLRGRVPVHQGQGNGLSNYVMGEQTGAENVTLLASQMPIHTHQVNAVSSGGNVASPQGALPAIESTGTSLNYSNGAPGVVMSAAMNAETGGSQPFSVIQPLLCVNFIIAMEGIFPSRN
jgi:microcystin-dependent protein